MFFTWKIAGLATASATAVHASLSASGVAACPCTSNVCGLKLLIYEALSYWIASGVAALPLQQQQQQHLTHPFSYFALR